MSKMFQGLASRGHVALPPTCAMSSDNMLYPANKFLPVSQPQELVVLSHRKLFLSPSGRRSRKKAVTAQVFDVQPGRGVKEFLELEFKVRDYELDQYGVVNNAVYASYCEHGGHQLLETIGIKAETITRLGCILAISQLSLKFLAPLRSGESFVLKVCISNISASRINFQYAIFKLPNEESILKGNSTVVFLDKSYRPVRIPHQIKSKVVQFLHPYDSSDSISVQTSAVPFQQKEGSFSPMQLTSCGQHL